MKSNNLGEQELPVDPELIERGFEGQAKIATVSAGEGTDLRIMVSPLFLQNETLLLEVAQSIEPVEEMMSQLRWTLFIGVLTALILAVVSGAVLARRALAPMERITSTAESIEDSSDLSRRVGYDGPKDEIGHLATTFDHMIEHLDRVFKSQKEFVADASHDLRGPLTVLKGNLDLLKRYLVEREHVESLDAMGREIERMTNIANDLLLLAEVESGQMDQQETVSLKEILMEGFRLAQESGKQHNATKGTYLSREIAIGWGRCWQTWSIMPSIIHLRAEVSHYRYFEMVIGPD
ncbi:MAG: HAMP domain-containing protein [Chloroflexi bacterium]|nr:HAMP domain-containing protein [Chloroflexota bacterium]